MQLLSSELLVLSSADITRAAPVEELIEWMRAAMRLTSGGDVCLPLRREFELPDDLGKIGIMPGHVSGAVNMAGVKLVSLVPPERRKGSSHLGVMVLYDADGLRPLALMCGATITAIRTSAVTAVATDALANPDSRVLTILGAGEQARAHAAAVSRVRDFAEFRVWSIDRESAQDFADDVMQSDEIEFEIVDDVAAAVKNADVICTVTSATDPFLHGSMVDEGAHLNLVGSSHRGAAEIDSDLLQRLEYFVDYRPSTIDQSGELYRAIEEGRVNEHHIRGELGEVLSGSIPGRTSDSAITAYKSVGVASQDIVTAHHVYKHAIESDFGVTVTL